MEWYQITACYFLCLIENILGLFFVSNLLGKRKLRKKDLVLCFLGTIVFIYILNYKPTYICEMSISIMTLFLLTAIIIKNQTRMILFLIIFYKLAIGLWEFMVSVGLGILLEQPDYIDRYSQEYILVVCLVRVILIIITIVLYINIKTNKNNYKFAVAVTIISFFGIISISEQSVLEIEDGTLYNWMMMTIALMFSILIYNFNHQYEIEKKVSILNEEKAELLKKDYINLNRIYSSNAKLYHDFRNHIEIMYQYAIQGKSDNVINYIEDLRETNYEIQRKAWLGDEVVDYLINSKLHIANIKKIATKVNIEYPKNTNIKPTTLTAVLGNLLDNAIEAATECDEGRRFINITIRNINYMILIKIENSMNKAILANEGKIISTKKDKKMHGWGLKSVQSAVKSCEGAIEISTSDGKFCAIATLFFMDKNLPIKDN